MEICTNLDLNITSFSTFKENVYIKLSEIVDVNIITSNDISIAKNLVDYFMEQKYSLGGITIHDIGCKCHDISLEDSENDKECDYCVYLKSQKKDHSEKQDETPILGR